MQNKNNKTKGIKRFVLLVFPFVLIFASLLLISFGAIRLVADSPSISAFLVPQESQNSTESKPDTSKETEQEDAFPSIAYGSNWATLNVEGWTKNTDIPVYFGDEDNILSKGAGMWIGSRFCGQNGKTVLSAHVTTDFYELETTPVGAIVTVNTVYGDYTYRVREVKVFDCTDGSLIAPEDGKDVLVMYTCYPRSVGIRYTPTRCALICDKESGKEWPGYGAD